MKLVSEGSLIIKILKRTAEFTVETIDFNDRNANRSGTLQIPKKTKVFVEQTIRERENAPGRIQMFLFPGGKFYESVLFQQFTTISLRNCGD